MLRAGGDELRDVGEHRDLVESLDTAVVHDRHRAVPASVRTSVRRLHPADQPLLAADVELGVPVERRQPFTFGERRIPRDRRGEVGALVGVEAERAHGPVDTPAPGRGARRVAVCIGTEKATSSAQSASAGSHGSTDTSMHADVVAQRAQMGGGRPEAPGLLPELVGGDEEDAHRSRLRGGPDVDLERGVSGAQRGLDSGRGLAAREQEAQVAVAFGQRHHAPAPRDGDLEARDPRHRARVVLPAHLAQHPGRGIGSIITPDAAGSRARSSRGMPSAWRRISSSSAMPAPNRSARAHSPPIERAATSITQTRSPSTRTSACTGPSVSPIAAQARPVTSYDALRASPRRGATA